MVKNKKDTLKIKKKGFKNKREIVTEIFRRKKEKYKENMEEMGIRICLKKIKKLKKYRKIYRNSRKITSCYFCCL